MTSTKIAISLPAELVDDMRESVRKRRAPSVSALVARAVRNELLADDLDQMLQEMLAETGGPLTEAEKRWADSALGHGPSRNARKKNRRKR